MKWILLYYILVILFLGQIELFGQNLSGSRRSIHTELTAYSTKSHNVSSFPGNQSVLGRLQQSGISIYTARNYLLPELSYTGLTGNIKTNSGGFGLQVDYCGFPGYNELKTGVAYGRKLTENLNIGLQFSYNKVSLPTYGSSSNFSIEAGTAWRITEQFQTGFRIINPVIGKAGKNQGLEWPTMYSIGFGYDPSPSLFVGTVIQKTDNSPVDIITGFQYTPVKQFFIRLGVSSLAPSAWLGVGLLFKNIEFDLTTYYHQQLGLSPGVMLLFNFMNNSK